MGCGTDTGTCLKVDGMVGVSCRRQAFSGTDFHFQSSLQSIILVFENLWETEEMNLKGTDREEGIIFADDAACASDRVNNAI